MLIIHLHIHTKEKSFHLPLFINVGRKTRLAIHLRTNIGESNSAVLIAIISATGSEHWQAILILSQEKDLISAFIHCDYSYRYDSSLKRREQISQNTKILKTMFMKHGQQD